MVVITSTDNAVFIGPYPNITTCIIFVVSLRIAGGHQTGSVPFAPRNSILKNICQSLIGESAH